MTTASSNNQLPSAGVQPPILTIANYPEWSASMRKNLEAQGLWEVVEARSIPRNSDNWRDKNNSALFTIRSSCDCLILSKIHDICSAKIVWDTLAKMYEMQMHGIYRVDAQQNVIRQVNLADLFKVNLAYLSTLNLGDLSTLSKPPSITVLSNATIWTFEIDRLQYGRMFLAVYKGDWIGLRDELESHGEALNAKVAPHGQLLIHIAARVAKDEITQELARLMARSDLEIQDSWGYTALTYAAFNGMIKTCKFLISLNDKLIYIQNINGVLPVTAACAGGHRETTSYLYSLTPFDHFYQQNVYDPRMSWLLGVCIMSGILDVGLDLLRRFPCLTLASYNQGTYTPFSILAMAASRFHSCSRLVFWKRWIYSLIHVEVQNSHHAQAQPHDMINPGSFIGLKQIYEMKLTHAYALEILRFMCSHISTIEF